MLEIKLLSAHEDVLSDNYDMLVLPSLNGNISIDGPSDRIFMSLLKAGAILCYIGNTVDKRFYIFSGSVLTNGGNVYINTDDEVFDLDDLDMDALNSKLDHCKQLLADSKGVKHQEYYQSLIDNYNALIDFHRNTP